MRQPKLAVIILIAILAFQSILQAHANPTWNIQVVDPYGAGGSIALDSSDNPHISYANNGLQYAVLKDSNWSIQTVDPSGRSGLLALDSNNNPHIIYKTATYSSKLKYAFWTGTNWTIHTIDSAENTWIDNQMVLDSKGNPHILYTYQRSLINDYTRELSYAVWTGSNWAVQVVDSSRVGTWWPSIALDSHDNPHITYHDVESDVLKYAKWSSSEGWSIQTVDSTHDAQSSVAVDSEGFPHISYVSVKTERKPAGSDPNYPGDYFISINNGLKYASWNGTAWDIQTVDSNSYLGGQNIYLVLDSNDNPHISYFLPGLFNNTLNSYEEIHGLNYAVWTGTEWSTQTVGTDVAGAGPIALDSHGKPHISYCRVLGTQRGAPVYGSLTYATLEATPILTPTSLLITIFAATAVVVVLAVLFLVYRIRRKGAKSSPRNMSPPPH